MRGDHPVGSEWPGRGRFGLSVWTPSGHGRSVRPDRRRRGYRAVRQDIAVTVVDWPVVHGWTEDDPDFVGAVTVLDHAGRQLVTADWAAPTDDSADSSLSGMGWRRVGPWERDWLGRRAALVTPVRALPRQADR